MESFKHVFFLYFQLKYTIFNSQRYQHGMRGGVSCEYHAHTRRHQRHAACDPFKYYTTSTYHSPDKRGLFWSRLHTNWAND